jgi:hypothetical protein
MREYVPRVLELVPQLWEHEDAEILRPTLLAVLKSSVIVHHDGGYTNDRHLKAGLFHITNIYATS